MNSNHVRDEVYSIKHYMIKFVSDLRQTRDFLRILRFPPPIKQTFYWAFHRHLFHSKNICPPPLPYFKVNICPFPFPHFASIFFAYLWSFRWPNYIVTLPRYFSFRLLHLNITTGPPSDELDKNIQRTLHFLFFSHWNGYSHFRSGLNWFRN